MDGQDAPLEQLSSEYRKRKRPADDDHHDAKDETSWDHPLDSHFKQLVADTRKRMAAGADAGAEPPSAGTPEPNAPADDADPM